MICTTEHIKSNCKGMHQIIKPTIDQCLKK